MPWDSPDNHPLGPAPAPEPYGGADGDAGGNRRSIARWLFLAAVVLLIGVGQYAGFSDEGGSYVAGRVIGEVLILGFIGGIAWLVRRRTNPERTFVDACLSWPVLLIWVFFIVIGAAGNANKTEEAPKQGAWTAEQRRDFLRGCRTHIPAEFKSACGCLVDKVEQRWTADDWAELERSGRWPRDTERLVDECIAAFEDQPKSRA